jgi:cytochrome c2
VTGRGALLAPLALALLVAAMPRPAAAAGDAAAGKLVFGRCQICHSIGGGARVGPDLAGIFGRKAGTWDDFSYSAAMKHSGIVWNDKTLAEYLKNPRQFIPGNNMAFPGLGNDKDIADLLAYLHQAAK